MKMVKIEEDLYLNSDYIESVEADGENSTLITMTSGAIFSPNVSIEKVIDAICNRGEQNFIGYNRLKNKDLVQKAYVDVNNIQNNHYSIIVSNDNAGAEIIVTKSEILSSLDLLKNGETLTIKRTK